MALKNSIPSSGTAPSPWKKTRDPEKEREIKRDAVLRTAAQIFNEKGFHATSLDEVAERLAISKPTLYYYVKNKDDILFQCVRRGLEMTQEAIREVGLSGGTSYDKLVAAMRAYAHVTTMDFGMCVIRVGEDPLPRESRAKLRHMKGAIDSEFRELIRQGIEEGSMVACDPKLAAFAIAGALSWIGRWYRPDGPETPDQIADQFIELLSLGFRATGHPGDGKKKPVRPRQAAVKKPAVRASAVRLVAGGKSASRQPNPKTPGDPKAGVPAVVRKPRAPVRGKKDLPD